jgi:serine/threonine protein kinase
MSSTTRDVKSIFGRALEIADAADRAAFLDEACGENAALRADVDGLLHALDKAGGFLHRPAPVDAGTGAYEPPTEAVGLWIGPYKLLQQIGEGGMGTVWMAEQEHPVRRRVALKVIKPGMDSSQVLARFEAERQALALMDHQNIAKVFDAGTAPQGRPYFVMELIKGVPITKFCDEHHLTPRERLELFVPVCQAVQHAHQKGVIHRDLKPSNVLVTLYDGKPVPKVIDFGVAKALHAKLTDRTLFTDFGVVVGTLEYMAPEQAALSHLDVDTRSDVYSLGVLLYELLTGTTPFERKRLRSAALDEILKIIREEEPPKPSTRLSESGGSLPSIAAARKTEPAKLSRLVRGELDWIVMKALDKDRGRRYETANGFARDIQRYLADEAVEACPPSAGYRLRKFVRRHRGRVAVAALVLFALVGGVIGASWGMVEARRQRDAAEAERLAAAEARDRAEAAQQRAKDEADKAQAERDKAEAARALADRNFQTARAAVEDYLERVTNYPNLKNNPNSHELRKQLLASALPFYEEFVRQKSDDPKIRSDQGAACIRLAAVHVEMGDHQAALREYTSARDIVAKLAADFPAVPLYRRDLAYTHDRLGDVLWRLVRRPEAEAEFRAALAIEERLVADFPAVPEYRSGLASSHHNLGLLLRDLQRRAEAEVEYRAALAIFERVVADHPATIGYRRNLANVHNSLGILLRDQGRRPEAEAEYRAALVSREKLAADFPAVPGHRHALAQTHHNLGIILRELGRRPEAEAEFRAALALQEKLAADFPAVLDYRWDLAQTRSRLGESLRELGRRPEAEVEYRAALALLEKLVADFPAMPDYRSELANSHANLAILLSDLVRRAEAEAEYRSALAVLERLVADSPTSSGYRRNLANIHNNLGLVLRDLGRRAEAEAEYRAALAIQEKLAADFPAVPGYRHDLAAAHGNLGNVLRDQAKYPEAEAAQRAALAIDEKLAADFPAVPNYRVSLAGSYINLGLVFHDRGESPAALDWYAKAIPLLEGVLDQDSRNAMARQFLRNAHWYHAEDFRRLGRPVEAIPHYDRALSMDDGSRRSAIRLDRADAVAQTGDHARAVAEAEELTRGDKVSSGTLYYAAGVYALASAAVKDDAPRQESYGAQAVALLRRAQAADYFKGGSHIDELKTDADLAPLRERADFQVLVKELEAKK